ncbi:MAG: MBL fold metallo-hydrolase [Oscillospiraceae bacterium]|nr:MBL fold metallo-hydrolase [Oscillospiraceae bacterium]
MRKNNLNLRNLSAKNKVFIAVIALWVCVSALFTISGKWHDVYVLFRLRDNMNFASSESASVHFIDVGQGDCALIITPEKTVLIDSGEREYSAAVINYLRAQSVTKLDYIIVSHPHSDHIGSTSFIIDEFGAEFIIMPRLKESYVPTSSAFLRLLDSIENGGVEVIWAKPGMIFELSTDSKMEILAPLFEYDGINDNSVVVKFSHTAGSFLFTGDIEAVAENDLVESEFDISADVLKIAHHGSRTSSSARFINSVNGQYAIICVGTPNSYNHPTEEVLDRLINRNYEIFRTDLHGSIVFDCTDDGFMIYVQRGVK